MNKFKVGEEVIYKDQVYGVDYVQAKVVWIRALVTVNSNSYSIKRLIVDYKLLKYTPDQIKKLNETKLKDKLGL